MAKSGDISNIRKDILIRYYGPITKIRRDYMEPAPELQEYNSEWIWGPSGHGKSTLARDENPNSYPKMLNKWWDGYKEGMTALLEDIDPVSSKHLAHHCKIWLDKFDFVAEAKGDTRRIRPPKVVITSQYTIEQCFNAVDAVAIRRRCVVRKVVNFQEVPDDSHPNFATPAAAVPTFNPPPTPPTRVLEWYESANKRFNGIEDLLDEDQI